MKKNPNYNIEITEKDLLAMLLIYYNGILAKNHLQRLVWKTETAKNRLTKLFDHGYLKRDPYVIDRGKNKRGKKQTTMYSLTNKAIRYIGPYIQGTIRDAFNNTPGETQKDKPKRRREFYQMGELWCQLFEQNVIHEPLQLLPSRLAKTKYKLNNRLPFHAMLENKHGYDFFFYMDEKAHPTRPNNIKTAIKDIHYNNAGTKDSKLPSNNRYFILAADPCEALILKKFTETKPEQNIYCINIGTKQIHRQNYTPIITQYTEPNYYYQEIKDRLYSRYGNIELIQSTLYNESFPYKFYNNDNVIYVVELITGSINNLEKLMLKATTAIVPTCLFAYIPVGNYYYRIRELLPEGCKEWFNVIIRSRPKGNDVFGKFS